MPSTTTDATAPAEGVDVGAVKAATGARTIVASTRLPDTGPSGCWAASARRCPRRPRSAPSRHAAGTRTTAAMATRPQATTPGEKSPTAILMNRYGMPQRAETAANVTHARAVIDRRDAFMPAMETWE